MASISAVVADYKKAARIAFEMPPKIKPKFGVFEHSLMKIKQFLLDELVSLEEKRML